MPKLQTRRVLDFRMPDAGALNSIVLHSWMQDARSFNWIALHFWIPDARELTLRFRQFFLLVQQFVRDQITFVKNCAPFRQFIPCTFLHMAIGQWLFQQMVHV